MQSGRIRRIAIGAASLAALACLSSAPAAAQPPEAAAALAGQLAEADEAYARQGYASASAPFIGGLRQGDRARQVLTLRRGKSYRVLGICDNECGDLDLRLYDADGDLIDEDTRAVEDPEIGIRAGDDGEMSVEVIMYSCAATPCYYAIALYGR